MGTNFYLHFHRSDVELGKEGIHIGKNSCGWVFHFEAHNNPCLKTVKDMKAFTKLGFIYDEYEVEHTYEGFWDIVARSKESFNGRAPYVLEDPEHPEPPIFPSWEDEGFAFTEGDFC